MRLLRGASPADAGTPPPIITTPPPAAGPSLWQSAGLQRDPNTSSPLPELFFATPAAKKLHASLISALRFGDGGLFVLTGEAGIGKTMLLRVLESELREAGEPVLLHDSGEAGVLAPEQLHAILGDGTILLIDGMEHWDGAATSAIEMLFAFGGKRARSARLVISGQPEIEARLQRAITIALGTTITFARLRMTPLDTNATGDFLLHRLRQSGLEGPMPLAPATVQRIAEEAAGIPRRIIELGAAALDEVWAASAKPTATARPTPVRLPLAAGIALALAVAAGGIWFLRQAGSQPAGAADVAPAVVAQPAEAPAPTAPPPAGVTYAVTYAEPDADTAAGLAALAPAAGGQAPSVAAMQAEATPATDLATAEPAVAVAQPVEPSFEAENAALMAAIRAAGPPPAPAPAAPTATRAAAPMTVTPATVAPAAPPAPPASPAAVAPALTREQIASYLRRAGELVENGDIAAARLLYERAAQAGDPRAMRALGQTYDPRMLRQWGVVGLAADEARAQQWYAKAAAAEPAARR